MAKQQVYKLDNGATIIYQHKGDFNGMSCAVGFNCGSQLDGKYKGLSHLLEHLLFSSSNPESTNSILDNVLKYTINQNAYTSKYNICVTFSTVYKNTEQALKNLASMITKTDFSEDQIKQEIQIVKHEIAMTSESMRDEEPTAYDYLMENLSNNEHYISSFDILGNNKSLSTITPKLLSDYVKKYFNLDNLVVSVTSNKPLDEVVELFDKHIFRKLKPASDKKYIIPLPAQETFKEENSLFAFPNPRSQNISICLLLRQFIRSTDINLEYACDVVEEYMLNNMGGILWKLLRVDQQLAYTYNFSNVDYGDAKFKTFEVMTSPAKMRKTIAVLCKAIKELEQNGVSEEDFNKIKKVITDINTAKLRKFKNEDAESNYRNYIYQVPFIDYKKVDEHIKNLTYEDFNEYLKMMYSMPNVCLSVDGNFNSKNCYSLIEIEKMLGNYANVDLEDTFNLPIIQSTPIAINTDQLVVEEENQSTNADVPVTIDNQPLIK